jgi:hypothetical protein
MMQLVNTSRKPLPTWLPEQAASFHRLHLKIEEAFWASETLVDQAMGDEIFRATIEGIREDEEGPQIDIEGRLLPSLDNEVLLITDNTQPVDEKSERTLVAFRLADLDKVKTEIRKWMEAEPDTRKLDAVPGVEIWHVERGPDSEKSLDDDVFGDLGLDFDEQEQPRLLEHWAIAAVPQGPGSNAPYLLFSSHPALLIETVQRILDGQAGGFAELESSESVVEAIQALGGDRPAYERLVRMRLSLRAKYELLRQGKLRDSDSVLVSLYRRLFEDETGGEPDPLNATKLPKMESVEQYFPDGGGFIEMVDDGWEFTGFLLK